MGWVHKVSQGGYSRHSIIHTVQVECQQIPPSPSKTITHTKKNSTTGLLTIMSKLIIVTGMNWSGLCGGHVILDFSKAWLNECASYKYVIVFLKYGKLCCHACCFNGSLKNLCYVINIPCTSCNLSLYLMVITLFLTLTNYGYLLITLW